MILRAFMVWLVIVAAEVFQGTLRVRYLNRRVGDRRARQIGVFSSDFDMRRGGLLGIGMLILFAAPMLVAKLRGLI
jgi:hypothetical protein